MADSKSDTSVSIESDRAEALQPRTANDLSTEAFPHRLTNDLSTEAFPHRLTNDLSTEAFHEEWAIQARLRSVLNGRTERQVVRACEALVRSGQDKLASQLAEYVSAQARQLAEQKVAVNEALRLAENGIVNQDLLAASSTLPSDLLDVFKNQSRIHGRSKVYTAYQELLKHRLQTVRILAEIVRVRADKTEDVLQQLYRAHYDLATELCPFTVGQNFVTEIAGKRAVLVLAGIVFRPSAPFFRLLVRLTKEVDPHHIQLPDYVEGYSDLFFWDRVGELVGIQNYSELTDTEKKRVEKMWSEGIVVTRPPWMNSQVEPLIHSDKLQVFRYNEMVEKYLKQIKTPDFIPVATMDINDLLASSSEVRYLNPKRLDPSKPRKHRSFTKMGFGDLVRLVNSKKAKGELDSKLKFTCHEYGIVEDPEKEERRKRMKKKT